MKKDSYFSYYSYGVKRYTDKVLIRIRREILENFLEYHKPTDTDKILDVGVSSDSHPASNYLEKHYQYPENITGVGVEDHTELESAYPGFKFVHADGRDLPFEDHTFDYVYSHAVIEHVGPSANQIKFLEELIRVSRKGVMVTTPNRFHPIETHTGIPLIHYLPNAVYHRVYSTLGFSNYNSIHKLNLLAEKDLLSLAERSSKGTMKLKIMKTRWLGFNSNLILQIITSTRGSEQHVQR